MLVMKNEGHRHRSKRSRWTGERYKHVVDAYSEPTKWHGSGPDRRTDKDVRNI